MQPAPFRSGLFCYHEMASKNQSIDILTSFMRYRFILHEEGPCEKKPIQEKSLSDK